MTSSLADFVGRYGYVAVAGIITLEGVGLPVPGETILITAAAVAARGELTLAGVIAAAFVGTLLGGTGGYWIGRIGGAPLLRRHGRWLHVNEERLQKAHGYFEHHGSWTVFIARFVAFLRQLAGLLAGVACMNFGRFSIFNAAGGLAWAVAFGALGYEFGANLPLLEHYGARVSLALAILVVIIVLCVLLFRRLDVTTNTIWAGLRRFAAARTARGQYLGLHLTAGLMVSLAALWLFGGITEDVIHHDPLTSFDQSVHAWFVAHGTPFGFRVAVFLSLVGSPAAMGLVAAVGALILVQRRTWYLLAAWVAAFVGGWVLDSTLKDIVRRPRPQGASAWLHGMSYSFPSGHAMGSLIGYGMLAYVVIVFWLRGRAERGATIAVAGVLVVAIGISRLYLGVHYFSDVVGGYAAGLVWLGAVVSGAEVVRRKPAS